MKELRPYQQEAVEKFRGCPSAFFAMEMRLGKTLASIRWVCGEVPSGVVLVAAPLAVLISWKDELDSEGHAYLDLTDFPTADRAGLLSVLSGGSKVRFALINYEGLRGREDMLLTASAWLLDESTVLKGHRSSIARTFMRVAEDYKGPRACLSGMPAPQCVSELWTQMAIISGGKWLGFSNYYSFMQRMSRTIAYQTFFSKAKKFRIKQQFHKDAYVLSRKEAGIQETWVITKRSQPMPPAVAKLYQEILKTWAIPGLAPEIGETKYGMVITGWLRRLCGGFLPKTELPCWKYKDLRYLLAHDLRNESVVVWCAFNDEIFRLNRELGLPYLCGQTPKKDREKVQRSFQSGEIRVLVVQIALGKFGIRLDRADVAVYFSNAFSCEKKQQSKDRIVNVTKGKSLLRIEYVTKDSIEEDVLALLEDQNDASRDLLSRIAPSKFSLGDDRPRDQRDRVGDLGRQRAERQRIDNTKSGYVGRESRRDTKNPTAHSDRAGHHLLRDASGQK